MNLGDTAAAEEHARAALPVMERLGAMDDVVQLRALLALCAIAEERLADAAAELERLDAIDDRGTLFGGIAFRKIGAGELALARGEIAVRAAHLPGVRGGPGGRAAAGDRADRPGAVGHARRIDRARGARLPRDDRRRRRVRPRGVRDQPRARPPRARPGEPASRLPGHRPRAVRARRLGPAARRDVRRRRGRAARPRRALRLQPDDPDDGVGADRAGAPRRAPPAGSPRCATSLGDRRPPRAARRGARPRRAASGD